MTSLDLPSDRRERALERLLEMIRETRSLDENALAGRLEEGGRELLPGFRGVLNLRESEPRARGQLAGLIAEFDPAIDTRLATLARELPDHEYYTMNDVIAGRGYRRVHTTALGTGALMMWSFANYDTDRHWGHGIATGILASVVVGEHDVLRDRAFAAGLLHDIGRLALAVAPAYRGSRWIDETLVADSAGRLVSARLDLPGWLGEALHACELGPRGGGALESAVGIACATATQLGYRGGETLADPSDAWELRRLLNEQGGEEWLDDRIQAVHLAAQGHLVAVLAAT